VPGGDCPESSRFSSFLVRQGLFCLILGIGAFSVGCRKPNPSLSRQPPTITREMIAAARAASDGRAEIAARPERLSSGAADRIFITLPIGRGGQPDTSLVPALELQLDRVARAHRLRRLPRSSSPGFIRFDYQRSGQRTEMVEIIVPLVRLRGPAETPPPSMQSAAPRLAVIVDDLGNERAPAETLLALSVPISFAVLPQLPYSEIIAEEAGRRGFEVLLHLPIEPESGISAGEVELRPGMRPAEVEQAVAEMLKTVPNATGVNNHEGSRGTADAALMAELMPLLARRHLFFIDSRTTAATVAYEAAIRAGVPAASRNVFLDDTETQEAVRSQLELAVQDARRNGTAIAIGHPHPETLAVLSAELPKLAREGISLVFASELCVAANRTGISGTKTAQVSRASPPPSWPPSARSPAPR
jgi:hypothetical protein